eukprot:TRINITY_DN67234_c6_g15_i1.p1 TRINITY_DN67234_c6_g15~~TRINITY_DN67234_c6_g15_i1.p1  ORF type:complete len:329 (+),score=174.76 TRINITY_DN67234_c6_g15_i1:56-1042(+)
MSSLKARLKAQSARLAPAVQRLAAGAKSQKQVTTVTTTTKKKKQQQQQMKKQKRKRSEQDGGDRKRSKPNASARAATQKSSETMVKKKKKRHMSELQQSMQAKLSGAQFRWLNERLYTCTGSEALKMFQEDPAHFAAYHRGFRSQASKWPFNPNDEFIAFLRARPKLVVGDFGCGDAKIQQSVPNKVHSFDLVAANEHVIACDMANVPLGDRCLDVAVFSLSLMGTDYDKFLREAHRTLKVGGQLKVAEVESRFESHAGQRQFVDAVCSLGFRVTKHKQYGKMFVMFDFVKVPKGKTHKKKKNNKQGGSAAASTNAFPILKSTRYKKR